MLKTHQLLIGLLTSCGLMLGGLTVAGNSVQAAGRHYTTTPVSLRGKWTTPRVNGSSSYLHIAKYIFYTAGYQNGRKQSGA